MSRLKLTNVAVIAAALLMTLWAGAQATSMLSARPTAIATVDVGRIYNALEEKKQIDAELKTLQNQIEQDDAARVETLRQLDADLKVVVPDSPAFKQKRSELEFKVIETEAWRELKKRQLGSEQAIQKEKLYRKIVAAVGDVATNSGYDAVLYRERDVDFKGANSQQIDALIALRKVLWCKDELDITDLVTQKMNNDYANRM